MKKYLLLLLSAVIISSCTASDEVPKDCNCNRVVEVSSFSMQGQYTFGTYITINDCTGIQRQSTWKYSHDKPQKGDCR